jgi:hypothetical protein
MLGLLRELPILLEQLGCIAARAAVDPVEIVAIAALRAIATPTAPITAIAIQGNRSLISGLVQLSAPAANRPLVHPLHRPARQTKCQGQRMLRAGLAKAAPSRPFHAIGGT